MTILSDTRLCLNPVQHPVLLGLFEKQVDKFWKWQEIDYSKDRVDWETLDPDARPYMGRVLGNFANADNAVIENIEKRFRNEIQWPEAKMALAFQSGMEAIHVMAYNQMIEAVIADPDERLKLFQAVKHDPMIASKIEWGQKWAADRDVPLSQCLAAQCMFEGVGFASSFASIFWLRKSGKCPGICFGNEKILADENLHVDLFARLFNECTYPPTETLVHEMMGEMVEKECEFVRDALPKRLQGMNDDLMIQHVEWQADNVLRALRQDNLFGTHTPFEFMEALGYVGKTNYFEKNVAEYEQVRTETEIRTQQILLGDDC